MKTNYIECGDCLELIRQIPDKSIDLIVTDPPYVIEFGGAGGIYRTGDKEYIEELRCMMNGFSEDVLDEMCRVMKKINIYLFCSQKQIIPLLDCFVKKKNATTISYRGTNQILSLLVETNI